MNDKENKDIRILKEEILGVKDEIIRLNNLFFELIEELKINIGIKFESEDSKEIDDILKKCLDNF